MSYRFSVIIPVYNAEDTLRRCLDSLVCQTRNRAELILINDGSKDDSLNICREYERAHAEIRVIDQKNAGASSARNAGLDAAEGTYITFVDSDDYVPDNYFDVLDQTGDVDFAVYAYFRVTGNDLIPADMPQSILDETDQHNRIIGIIKNRFASPCNKRYKRRIIEENKIRFKKDLIIGEDFLFGLTYMLCCETNCASGERIYYVDESPETSVTRSMKYPASQSAKIYEYAFPVAEQCSWDDQDRERLLRELDYLFCRTSFVAAERLAESANRDSSLSDLIQQFYDLCRWSIKPIDLTHAIMKWCLKHKLLPIYHAVPFLHRLFCR